MQAPTSLSGGSHVTYQKSVGFLGKLGEKLEKNSFFLVFRAKPQVFENFEVKIICPASASVHVSVYNLVMQRIAGEFLEVKFLKENIEKERSKIQIVFFSL